MRILLSNFHYKDVGRLTKCCEGEIKNASVEKKSREYWDGFFRLNLAKMCCWLVFVWNMIGMRGILTVT